MERERDYNNKKPYRSKELKELARKTAKKDKYGHWHSDVPVLYHTAKKDLMKKSSQTE